MFLTLHCSLFSSKNAFATIAPPTAYYYFACLVLSTHQARLDCLTKPRYIMHLTMTKGLQLFLFFDGKDHKAKLYQNMLKCQWSRLDTTILSLSIRTGMVFSC